MKKRNVLGLMYAFVHFIVEVSCFYILSFFEVGITVKLKREMWAGQPHEQRI